MNSFKRSALLAIFFLVTIPARAAAPSSAPPIDRETVRMAIVAASNAHDYATATQLGKEWFARRPTDLDLVMNMPLYARLGGDLGDWDKWRVKLRAEWATLSTSQKMSKFPGFGVDAFKAAGDRLVYVMQCYETAGEFGVSYKFSVLSAATQQLLSFFTVESPIMDNRLAKELGRPSPVFTLDYFLPGSHETVAALAGKLDYDDLRKLVEAHMTHPNALSSSENGGQGLSDEGCEIPR